MRTVAEAYAPAVEESGHTLRVEIADGVQINGDRELLSLLFTNLVENALHHTPLGTTIDLLLSAQNGGVLAEVADNGAGIPKEERAKVFQRFYRLERSRTTAGTGSVSAPSPRLSSFTMRRSSSSTINQGCGSSFGFL
jgi:signal transduction histidine kinase